MGLNTLHYPYVVCTYEVQRISLIAHTEIVCINYVCLYNIYCQISFHI